MNCTNPTGGGVRNDRVGAGFWGAARGSRKHKGVDLLLPRGVGQEVIAPHPSLVKRHSLPYPSDERYLGVVLQGASFESFLWYLEPIDELIGQQVSMGQVIGYAQDISKKYGNGCLPHIHWQIGEHGEIDPLILL